MDDKQVTRSVSTTKMRVAAAPADVFPLLCPVREHDWLEGWAARIVHSSSGVAEQGCVFTTGGHGDVEQVWTVSRYDPPHAIAFVVVTPGSHVMTLEVVLEADAEGTIATWTYGLTPLSPLGEAWLARTPVESRTARVRDFEDRLGHYLATGQMLRGDGRC